MKFEFTLRLDIVLTFGMYKNKTTNFCVEFFPEYINWMIGNIDNLKITPNFLQDVVNINPDFIIEPEYLDCFHLKVQNFVEESYFLEYFDAEKYNEERPYMNIVLPSAKEADVLRQKIRNKMDRFITNGSLSDTDKFSGFQVVNLLILPVYKKKEDGLQITWWDLIITFKDEIYKIEKKVFFVPCLDEHRELKMSKLHLSRKIDLFSDIVRRKAREARNGIS